ncbi:DNA polymerase beta superfamily protein [Actinoplanes sp. NPDC026623]|uniref:nucleotidyltransferase domain-containing protein n=1 Tax=Actinoplanes sp. NPDC026623 TaxID=3155610 RepID=UPI00340602F4
MINLVTEHTILAVVVGSRAYGLDGPGSDHDRRGVYAAPTRLFWHLDKPPAHLDGPADEQFSWEIERFCTLALQANPTVLEVLWSPLIERITPDGERLLAVRHAFLSRRAAETYGAYARDQLKRVAARRSRTGETNHKQAMHMIRLLLAGAHVLRTGEVLVDVSPLRERLLAVRNGEVPWESVTRWADRLIEDLAAASVDSDLDLRACHLLPAADVVGLRTGPATLQSGGYRDGVELDVVSHDLLKFARLLNSRNGYVLEQLLSPLVVVTSPVHAALTELAPGLITRHHAHHYLGFAATQEKLFARTGELKPALYTLRVLLTGVRLMRTSTLETDLGELGRDLPYLPELIARKREAEHGPFPATVRAALERDIPRLRAELEAARDASALPDQADPAAVEALHDLVVRVRLSRPADPVDQICG